MGEAFCPLSFIFIVPGNHNVVKKIIFMFSLKIKKGMEYFTIKITSICEIHQQSILTHRKKDHVMHL